MGELISAGDIAWCVDVFHIRAKLIVNRDAFLGVVDAGFLEVETGDRWLPTGGDQQEIAAGFLVISRHDNLIAFPTSGFGPAPHKSDSFALKNALHHLASVRFVFRQQAIGDYADL